MKKFTNRKYFNNSGQSLLEVILALAIFSLIASAMVTMVTGNFVALNQGGEQTEAESLAQEAIEAIRSIRDGAWNELIYTTSSASISAGQWVFDGEGTTETIGKYARTISFDDVCRDSNDDIASCPSIYTDVQTKKITATVSWDTGTGKQNSVQQITYLTNWDSQEWAQTDWSGGDGQAIWSDTTKYESDDGNISTSTPGQIILAQAENGVWSLSGGSEFIDTSDTDFNAGTFTTTTITGTGDEASIVLATNTVWALHPDSASATTDNINSIHSNASSTHVWGVGQNGKIINYNGINWSEHSDIGSTHLNGVSITSDSTGWAVGDTGERYQYNGTSWAKDNGQTVSDTLEVDFNAGSYTNTTVSTTGSDASVILAQTTSWAEHVNSDFITQDINAMSIISASDIWAGTDSGKIIHYDGTNWTEIIDFGAENVNGIDMRTASDGWAVGASGKIWHYNGTAWSENIDTGTETWKDVAAIASDNVWAVGNSGKLAQYNGSTWTESTIPSSANINGVYALSASDIWAAGANGRIWHYNGTSWSLHTDTGGEIWNDIVMTSASGGWTVGDSGALAEYNGTSWAESLEAEGANIFAVYALSSSNIWAAGVGGRIYNYNGTSWSLYTDTGTENWQTIGMLSSTSGFVLGNSGEIFEYQAGNYEASGTFLSQIFDSGDNYNYWATSTWTEILSTGADTTIAFRSGNTAIPDATWSAFGSEFTNPASTNIDAPDARYLQYRITLTRGTLATETPQVDDVTITYASDITNKNLNDIDALSASDVWAVGNTAALLHFNGTIWTATTTAITDTLNAIDMRTASDGWAVGVSGKILHFDGNQWTENIDTGTEVWTAVAAVAADDVWVMGNGGKYIHYDGIIWSAISTVPSALDINDMYAVSASDIWAVGASARIWHYNGTDWSLDTDDTGTFNTIYLVGASDGWAGGNAGLIWQYSDFYESTGQFFSQIFNSGKITTAWSSISWTEDLSTDGDITVASRSGNTATPDGTWSAWSAELSDELGSSITSPDAQYLQYRLTLTRPTAATNTVRLDDITIVYDQPTNKNINDISAIDASNIWAVADNGDILNYNGTSWSVTTTPNTQNLNGVSMISTTDGWAVSAGGEIRRFNGSTWPLVVDTGTETWNSVAAISSNDAWAVGNAGKIAYWDGATWDDTIVSPTGNNIRRVVAVASNDVWAVANNGEFLHYDGASWTVHTTDPSTSNIFDIKIVTSTDGWAVGASRKFYKYNGTSWTENTDTGVGVWRSVDFVTLDDGWAVGDGGDIARWDGYGWGTSISSPTGKQLNRIVMISGSEGWAVGNTGTIIKFSRDAIYETSGTATSSAFDMGAPSIPQVILWDQTIPSCTTTCTIQFQIKTSPDSGGSPGAWSATWSGPEGEDGDETDYYTVNTGELINTDHNGDQWIQYRAVLTGDNIETPVLTEVNINYKRDY